jgi:cation transport regulator ChaC
MDEEEAPKVFGYAFLLWKRQGKQKGYTQAYQRQFWQQNGAKD